MLHWLFALIDGRSSNLCLIELNDNGTPALRIRLLIVRLQPNSNQDIGFVNDREKFCHIRLVIMKRYAELLQLASSLFCDNEFFEVWFAASEFW